MHLDVGKLEPMHLCIQDQSRTIVCLPQAIVLEDIPGALRFTDFSHSQDGGILAVVDAVCLNIASPRASLSAGQAALILLSYLELSSSSNLERVKISVSHCWIDDVGRVRWMLQLGTARSVTQRSRSRFAGHASRRRRNDKRSQVGKVRRVGRSLPNCTTSSGNSEHQNTLSQAVAPNGLRYSTRSVGLETLICGLGRLVRSAAKPQWRKVTTVVTRSNISDPVAFEVLRGRIEQIVQLEHVGRRQLIARVSWVERCREIVDMVRNKLGQIDGSLLKLDLHLDSVAGNEKLRQRYQRRAFVLVMTVTITTVCIVLL